MALFLWPALVVAGCVYAWYRTGSGTQDIDEDSFYMMSSSSMSLSKPSAIYLRLDASLDTCRNYLDSICAEVLNVIPEQNAIVVTWNQDVFIQLCDTQLKEKLGLVFMSALHETVLLQ